MVAGDAGWRWVERFESLGFCLLFARGVSEEQLLAAYGCAPGSARVLTWAQLLEDEEFADNVAVDGPPVVRVGRVCEWAFGFEDITPQGGRPEVARRLPPGTESVSILRVANAFSWLRHAVDGVAVTEFEPLSPHDRRGREPDRLVPLMRQVGLNPDGPLYLEGGFDPTTGALDLITVAWGMRLSGDTITGPLLTAYVRPWPDDPQSERVFATQPGLLEPGTFIGAAGSVMPLRPRPR
jgi:hypothetical protein